MKIVNYTDLDSSFIKEDTKDYDTSDLIVKIKNSGGEFAGKYYDSWMGKHLLSCRVGNKNVYPYSVELYKRKGLQEEFVVNSRQELLEYLFAHEFMHFIQHKTGRVASEFETEFYAISKVNSKRCKK